MCGKDAMVREHHDRKKEKEHRLADNPTSATIVEQINGSYYTFDTANCVLMFKKFMDIYGSNFADQ